MDVVFGGYVGIRQLVLQDNPGFFPNPFMITHGIDELLRTRGVNDQF